MKKIISLAIVVVLSLLLISCKASDDNQYDEKLDQIIQAQEADEARIKELLDADKKNQELIESLIAAEKLNKQLIETLTSNLLELSNKVDNEENLAKIEELKELIHTINQQIVLLNQQVAILNQQMQDFQTVDLFEVNFVQYDESLVGQIYAYFPQVLPESFYFKEAKLTISHPLKARYDLNPIVQEMTLSFLTKTDISVEYHGLYELKYEVMYENENQETKTFEFIKPAVFSLSDINVTWLNGTMPTLLFAADLLTGVYRDTTTYVEIERSKTFDYSKFPENVLHFPVYASASQGNYTQTNIPDFWEPVKYQTDGKALHWIKELFLINPNINITFALVDNVLEAIDGLYSIGIPEANLNFKIYTDGAYTSNWINAHIKNDEQYVFYQNLFSQWRQDKLSQNPSSAPINNSIVVAASESEYFEYIVNEKDSWLIGNSDLIATNNIRVVSVAQAFENVNAVNKLNQLEFLLNTRWGNESNESMSAYFDLDPKKNLLILGTSPAGEQNAFYATFDKYIEKIIELYAGEYNIFYKGHPRYPSDEDRVALFATHQIVELPNSIPVETLMFLYNDVYIGGYNGTSFHSSQENQTVFLFGTIEYIKTNAVMRGLIEEGIIFANTDYLTVDENGNAVLQVIE